MRYPTFAVYQVQHCVVLRLTFRSSKVTVAVSWFNRCSKEQVPTSLSKNSNRIVITLNAERLIQRVRKVPSTLPYHLFDFAGYFCVINHSGGWDYWYCVCHNLDARTIATARTVRLDLPYGIRKKTAGVALHDTKLGSCIDTEH